MNVSIGTITKVVYTLSIRPEYRTVNGYYEPRTFYTARQQKMVEKYILKHYKKPGKD
jgi:hypothetical protein